MSVEAVFEAMPVDESSGESTQAPKETKMKEMGDRVRKGDTSSRIEAFGEMLEEPEYGGNSKNEKYEPTKVEKEKTPVAAAKDRNDGDKKEKEDDQEEEVLDKEETQVKKEAKQPEISKDTLIKVKVDGIDEDVTLEKLKSSYSHRQALDRRMSELQNEKKSFQKEKDQVLADGRQMQKEIADLKGGFESFVNEYTKNGFTNKNPLSIVDQLLDRIGIDSYTYNKAVFEHNLPEYAKFFEMDDVQRNAYFINKENEFLKKKDQTFSERTRLAQEAQQRQAYEYNLVKQSGLSIDDYNSHFDTLKDLGSEDLSVERVLEFAKVKPIFDRSVDIVSKTSAAGDVDKVQQVSKLLMQFPNTTEEEIIAAINGKMAAKEASKGMSGKENYTVDTSKVAKKSNVEDFTDEEYEMFRQIRRR